MPNKKILIIDDDKTSSLLVQSRLQANQYEVFHASDGLKGLEEVKSVKPDLIILDVEMPRMNGYTFMNEFKKLDISKTTGVLVLTSHAEHQPIFTLKGVRGYLLKPIDMAALEEKVKKSLEDSDNLRASYEK